jgi:hypothetical protein
MKWWFILLGSLAALVAVSPVIVYTMFKASSSPMNEVLVVGQTYVFTGDPTVIGEVLEPPRDQWVKVRVHNTSSIPAQATWVNLQRVQAVSLIDAAVVRKEAVDAR